MTAVVTDAAVVVGMTDKTDPALNLSGLSFNVCIDRAEDKGILIIEPATILDHEPLTPQLCRGGLQLVAPVWRT